MLGFNDVFIIGIYHGHSKPADSFEYLENFISKAKCIIENGIIYEKIKYDCVLKVISADAPAKSFILNTKGYSGYASCTKCTTYDTYVQKRVCFSDIPGVKRMDSDYEIKLDQSFHSGSSALEDIPKLGLVTNVPLDYLHLIYIGVMKKLFHGLQTSFKSGYNLGKYVQFQIL